MHVIDLFNESDRNFLEGDIIKFPGKMNVRSIGPKNPNDAEVVSLKSGPKKQSLGTKELAMISDKALDQKYGYGRSVPGPNFGWLANMNSAMFAKRVIDSGQTDIDKIAAEVHKGWATAAIGDYKNKLPIDPPTPHETKLRRLRLAQVDYNSLPESEKEKDRVVARALLKALTGKEDDIDEGEIIPMPTQGKLDFDGPVVNVKPADVIPFSPFRDPGARNLERWKQRVRDRHPEYGNKIRFVSKDNGKVISAEVPGLDRSFGVFDLETEKGHVLDEGLRDPKDNPCWKGYHPVGTKKKNGKTVPNCVPNANEGVEGTENPYGYQVGQQVELANGRQGRVLDIFDDSIEVQFPDGRTITVDFRDAQVLDEAEGSHTEGEATLAKIAASGDDGYEMIYDGLNGLLGTEAQIILQDMYDEVSREHRLHPDDDFEQIQSRMMDQIESDYGQQGVAEGNRFDEPLTGYHIVYKNSGNPVLNTPSFETKDQAQKYLMTKMFANHQDFKVVHTANVGVAEGARLIGRKDAGNRSVSFYRDTEWNEYIVQFFLDGKHQTEADYHTDDKQDAFDTATKWLKGFPKQPGTQVDEVSLGDYIKKAGMSKALSQMGAAFAPSEQERAKSLATAKKREKGLARAKTRTDRARAEFTAKSQADALAKDQQDLPQLKAELEKLKKQLDPNFEYSDDHSFWRQQKDLQAKIQHLEKKIARAEQVDEGNVGTKFPGYWKGTDSASKSRSKMVGASESVELNEVSDEMLINYLTKVHQDAMKHKMDPTRRSDPKRSKSIGGFNRAFNKLDARQDAQKDASKAQATEPKINETMKHDDFIKQIDELHKKMMDASKRNDTKEWERLKKEYEALHDLARQGLSENNKEGKPRIRKYSKMRPDGSKAVRYEVLDYRGMRIPGQGSEGFDDLKYAKEFYHRNYDKLQDPMDEGIEDRLKDLDPKNPVNIPAYQRKAQSGGPAQAVKQKGVEEPVKQVEGRYWCKNEKRWKNVE